MLNGTIIGGIWDSGVLKSVYLEQPTFRIGFKPNKL